MIPWDRRNFLPRLVATACFVGCFPLAPGTMGSLVAVLAFLLLPPYLSTSAFLLGLAALFAIAVWSAQQVVAPDSSWWLPHKAKRAASGNSDPSEVVIDEVMGMAVTLAFVPLHFKTIGLGFLLFRIFDVLKPFPARQSEKLPGGWGIVMDDVVAGIYANVSLQIIVIFFSM
jgi:phosphatidylglycerophosphatase A